MQAPCYILQLQSSPADIACSWVCKWLCCSQTNHVRPLPGTYTAVWPLPSRAVSLDKRHSSPICSQLLSSRLRPGNDVVAAPAVRGSFSRSLVGKHVPHGNAVAPPQLPADAPVPDVAQPLPPGALKTLGRDLEPAVIHCLSHGSCQLASACCQVTGFIASA